MTPTVVTHNSEPTSGDASVVERYWLEDDGRLTMEATLYDPAYYVHPVVRRTQWQKAADQEQDLRYDVCDPDSFYETLFRDGVMPAYFENRPE